MGVFSAGSTFRTSFTSRGRVVEKKDHKDHYLNISLQSVF